MSLHADVAVPQAHRALVPIRLAAQILVYPMLDDRTDLDESGFRLWDNRANQVGWSAYLGHEASAAEASPIGVGALDLFCDEDMAYAERLRAADVPCKTIVIEGVFHGFDGIVEDSAATQRFRKSMFDAIRNMLSASS